MKYSRTSMDSPIVDDTSVRKSTNAYHSRWDGNLKIANRIFRAAQKKPKKHKKNKKHKKGLLSAKEYFSYITSKRWAKRRRRYYATNPNTCNVCGSREEVTLHHLTYERLGMELDSDLMALCWKHHRSFHEKIGGSKKNMVEETKQFVQGAKFDDEIDNIMRNL